MLIRNVTFLFVLFLIALPATASAQSVIVLGINSLEGDDAPARDLTLALREALTAQGCHVSERDVSLMQMVLTHDCSSTNIACLDAISQMMDTGSVVFGIMHRANTDTDQELVVELHYFDRRQQRIIGHYSAHISLAPSAEEITSLARAAAPDLTDCVHIAADPLSTSATHVDEDETNTTSVSSEDHARTPITATQATNNEWVGWSLIGLGAAFVLADIAIWVRVNDLNNDTAYRTYRMGLTPTGNACTSETPANVRSICGEGAALEILQFVFIGLGIASAATGALLLTTGVLVTPSVSTDHATLTLSGSF